jgi:hypothetical protein
MKVSKQIRCNITYLAFDKAIVSLKLCGKQGNNKISGKAMQLNVGWQFWSARWAGDAYLVHVLMHADMALLLFYISQAWQAFLMGR